MSMKTAIIGAGNMGGAIARAIAAKGPDSGFTLCVANRSEAKLKALAGDYGFIATTCCNREAAEGVSMVVVAVKPWILDEVIAEIAPVVAENCIVVSVVAGCDAATLHRKFTDAGARDVATFYCIPNTAVAVGCGMTFYSSHNAGAEAERCVESLFSSCGLCLKVDARKMPAGMAVASCGIAYALRYMRAAMEGGVQLGLAPDEALQAIAQTLRGAAALMEQPGAHPEREIDRVTTPGGITIKGLNAMERAGFSAAVVDGFLASK